jgi:predicted alpha-1,2-mannosidase
MGSPGFVEGSAWQYLFMVNHDIPGLIELVGGPARFTARLQEAFDAGHYKLNNEPDMAYPYLFTFVPGESWRTARQVRKDLATEFRRADRWLPGNDDAGATSAVYVWGAMGFYPLTPGLPEYRLGSPLFDKVVLHLDTKYALGPSFTIEARHNSADNIYVQSATLNGQPLTEARLPHEAILKGGSLVLEMGTGR